MFNGQIVEKIMESVINSRKESTFRYLNSSIGLEKIAEEFLSSDESRLMTINCNDVFNFLVKELKELGFYYSQEGIFVHQNLFDSVQDFKNNILSNSDNDGLNLLIFGSNDSNFKILDFLSALCTKDTVPDIILDSVITDIGFILSSLNTNDNIKGLYEKHTLNLLSFAQTTKPFKNVLSFNSKISGVFELISNLPQRNNILFDLVNDVDTITTIPNQRLLEFMIEVPSHIFNNLSSDAFLGLLNILPISYIINYGTSIPGNQETLFSKYTLKIKSMIDKGEISSEFLDTLKEQANTTSPEGQILLGLLGEAIAKFLNNGNLASQSTAQPSVDMQTVEPTTENASTLFTAVDPNSSNIEAIDTCELIEVAPNNFNQASAEISFDSNNQQDINNETFVKQNVVEFNPSMDANSQNNNTSFPEFPEFSEHQAEVAPMNNFCDFADEDMPKPGPFYTIY